MDGGGSLVDIRRPWRLVRPVLQWPEAAGPLTSPAPAPRPQAPGTGHWSCRVMHCRYNDLASASKQQTDFHGFLFCGIRFPEDAFNIVKAPSFLLIKGLRQSQVVWHVIWAWWSKGLRVDGFIIDHGRKFNVWISIYLFYVSFSTLFIALSLDVMTEMSSFQFPLNGGRW